MATATERTERAKTGNLTGQDPQNASKSSSSLGVGGDQGSIQAAAGTRAQRGEKRKAEPVKDFTPIGGDHVINSAEVDIILTIIGIMDQGAVKAMQSEEKLRELGDQVKHLHPLLFLWAILKDPSQRNVLGAFHTDMSRAFLWAGVMGYSEKNNEGVGKSLIRECKGKALQEVQPIFDLFFESLGLDKSKMQPLLKGAFEATQLEAARNEAAQEEDQPNEEEAAGGFWGAVGTVANLVSKGVEFAREATGTKDCGPWDGFVKATTLEENYVS